MSIIREKIRFTNQNISGLTINLGSNIGFLGYQQEINNLTQATALEIVNPVVDAEKRKFKMGVPLTRFEFWFEINMNSFLGAGFTAEEIVFHAPNMLNSFFILDFYDSYNPNKQTKIFTTYLTKLGIGPSYNVSASTDNQLYYWYVPISYMSVQTGSTVVGYVKFSFYNAKTGKVTQFYNQYNATPPIGLTPEKQYFKAELNLLNNSWRFLNLVNSVVIARELVNVAYSERVDNTFTNYDNVKQQYPAGTTYNYKTNKYITPTGNTATI